MTSESAGTHDQTPAERQAALDARRSPEGYDVAPLEWYKHNRSDLERYSAEPVFASYIITWTASGYDLYIGFWGSAAEPRKPPFKTVEEAKAAAQADYRQRILSALRPRQETAPAVGGEPFEWRCPACGCQTYARVDERSEDGHFRPGSAVRCVNCKAVYNYPAPPMAASARAG